MIPAILIAAATLLIVFGPLPALISWLLLFGRCRETTMADLHPEGTYYEPYAEEMRAAEERILGDPEMRRVETVSEDGIRLCADLLPGTGDRAVILIHGFMTAPTKNFAVIAESYRAAGYTILMAHLRGHGPSGGKHTALGAAEWKDAVAWIRWCRENLTCRHLVLHGASMGAAAVGCAADLPEDSGVRALVIDSGFISPWDQLHRLGRRWHVPTFLTLPILNLLVRISTGADLRRSVQTSLRVTRIPVLFVHGTADTTVDFEQGKANYECCTSEKEFLAVEGAEHTLALIAGGEEIRAKLLTFIDRQIPAEEAR